MNAKKELLEHVNHRVVKYVRISYEPTYNDHVTVEGTLEEVLPKLDFDYYSGFGVKKLEGTIWYSDGTWSDRAEYDGSEWWVYRKCPPLPTAAILSTHVDEARADNATPLQNQTL